MNKYVYVLLDPRKPTKFEYGDTCFLYEPYYVGKGTREDRIRQHFSEYNRKKDNRFKAGVINKIKAAGFNGVLYTVRIKESLSEEEANKHEIETIKHLKEKFRLTNLTEGGEGTSWRKGKTFEEMFGEKKAAELKENLRNNCIFTQKDFKEKAINSIKKRFKGKTREEVFGKEKAVRIGEKISKGKSRSVCQIDIETGEILNTFPSAREAAKILSVGDKKIRYCLSNPNARQAYGFVWVFEDLKDDFVIKPILKPKKVCKIDVLTLEVIEIYIDIHEASRANNIVYSTLGGALCKKTKTGGFYWKYLNDEDWEPKANKRKNK